MEGSIKNFTKNLHHKRLYLSPPRIGVIGAFDEAWSVLKALREQQGFTMSSSPPTEYGQENTSMQLREGTIHPAILGMMERRQSKNYGIHRNAHMPFPDRRVRDYSESDFMEPNTKYGTIMAQGPRELMTGDTSDDELTDAGQRKRGSVFDAGHYNRFGYPMVGVAQGYDFSDFSPEYRVSNYNKLPE